MDVRSAEKVVDPISCYTMPMPINDPEEMPRSLH